MLKRKFYSARTKKLKSVGDLQQVALEKQQHGELSLQQQGSSTQGTPKEPKICLPMKFDGTRLQFRGFLN